MATERELPGAERFPDALQERLDRAVESRGADYRPRTRHRNADGSARFTNRLALESSPYLLQHAHNPVNWYPWGEEAFRTAARLGRPVLLSIGYSTCHWCHVMEEESFEDLEIAAFVNTNYVAIKVDREERPDLDAIYMSAVQMLTGRGGWPMTTWLTPEGKPFYGGTYFPARDGDRGAARGFLSLLGELKRRYDDDPQGIAERAAQIANSVRSSLAPAPGSEPPSADLLHAAARGLAARFDPLEGGVGRAPKFPSSLPVRLLLRQHRNTGDAQWLTMAALTLEKMAAGGLYDQIGGGFHRYATDRQWLVPHFEKMLYDNALLTLAYLEGYQVTEKPALAQVVREVLRYVAREMTSPDGAFYSATDADSLDPGGEREEGRFFTWTPAEIRAVLDSESARLVEAYYGVTPAGNFEGRNILHVARGRDELAQALELPPETFDQRLKSARERLVAARAARPAPLLDDKILAAWNGLMIQALARAGRVLHDPRYVERAARAAAFVLKRMRHDGRLRRSFRDGAARHNAYLEDYAFLIAGLLDLYEATSEANWLGQALSLQAALDEHYADERGGYFTTSDDHEALLAREKSTYDGAEPSGNSVALMNLLRLAEWTTNDAYRRKADALLRAYGDVLRRSPGALSEMLLGLDFRHGAAREIVIVTRGSRAEAEPFLRPLRREFVPHAVLVVAVEGPDLEEQARLVPLLEGKVARGGAATAYVCQAGVCRLPTTDPEVFRKLLTAPDAPAEGATIPRKK